MNGDSSDDKPLTGPSERIATAIGELLGFALVSVPFTGLFAVLMLATGNPWWWGAVIGPLLTLELWGILEARDAYRKLQAKRQRARERGAPPEVGGIGARAAGWAADHPGAFRLLLVFSLVAMAVAVEGGVSTWVLTLVAVPLALTIVLRAWRRVRHRPPA